MIDTDQREKAQKPAIAIIGTGLIGCSMADGLKDIASEIIGVDTNAGHLQEALDRGWIDRSMSMSRAVGYAEIIILSVPVDVTVNLLPLILDQAGSGSVIIDAGSVKGAICRGIRGHPGRDKFVAAHPMAGLAVAGPEAAGAGLFRNKKALICEHEKSSGRALEAALSIFDHIGMDVIYMEPDIHDLYVAKVSHLPQIMAYCLSSLTGRDKDKKENAVTIASTGFESSTRLASSPADMWVPIFQHNDKHLYDSLDEMIILLTEVRDMIKNGRWQNIQKLIEEANMSREYFISAYKQI